MIGASFRDKAAALTAGLAAPRRMLIDGQWVTAKTGETFAACNPANGNHLADIQSGDRRDVDRAVAAARRAFDGPWRRVKPADRQRMLLNLADLIDRHFEELSLLDCLDMGAPVSQTIQGFRRRSLARALYAASSVMQIKGETIENSVPGELLSFTLKEPVGVVGAIIPWNAPLGMAIWKLAPALAAGCTVVLKPAEDASLSSLRLAELVCEAGFPDGVVNVVTGIGAIVGAALGAHPDVDKISFTGSTAVGRALVQASAGNLKRLTLELGGKSPNIVFPDADLDAAVIGAAHAAFANTGQACIAGSRLYVHRSIYDDFVQRVAAFGRSMRIGDPLDPETQLGPLVSARQLERVTGYMSIGEEEGARAICGGARCTDSALAQGHFVPPTVFTGVNDTMRIAREEIFGPVVAAIPFDSEEAVIASANATPYGLAAAVWTKDISRALRMTRRLRAGTVWINTYHVMDAAVPLGGYKMSGHGREGGMMHLDSYLETKSVWMKED